jgi:methyltransferase family protein
MKNFLHATLGVNLAAAIRGLRFGLPEFGKRCQAGYHAIRPFEKPVEKSLQEEFDAIPTVILESLLGEKKLELRLRVMQHEDGMMPLADAIALLSVLLAERPAQVLEIGTYMGHTTRAMAENLETAAIHTADLPPDFFTEKKSDGPIPKDDFHLIKNRIVGREFKNQPCEKRIVQHFGDTAAVDFKQFGQPNFFFIDGSHTYEYCKNDSEKCLAIAPRGSTFLWHDCGVGHPGVIRFISEWRRAGRNIVRIHGTTLGYWKNV